MSKKLARNSSSLSSVVEQSAHELRQKLEDTSKLLAETEAAKKALEVTLQVVTEELSKSMSARDAALKETQVISASIGRLLEEKSMLLDRYSSLENSYTSTTRDLERKRKYLDRRRRTVSELRYLLQEVLESVVQVHRRELRAWKEASIARSEVSSLREGIAYRLGVVLVERMDSLLSLIYAPFALRREYRRLRAGKLEPSRYEERNLPVGVSFHGTTKIAMPLTLRAQTVLVPPVVAHDVWVTALSATPTAQIVVEMSMLGDERDGAFAVSIESIRGVHTPNDVGYQFRLKAGRPVRLLSIRGATAGTELSISRRSGEFCILLLQLCQAGVKPSRPSGSGGDASERGERRTIDGTKRRKHSVAADLEQKLWGGFAGYAIPELERLKCDLGGSVSEHVAAAWYLARWFYVSENYASALENVTFAKTLQTNPAQRMILAEAQTLIKLGRYDEAVTVLGEGRATTPDYALLESTAVRYVKQARNEPMESVEAAQLSKLNEVFVSAGIAPLEKKRKDAPLSLANIVAHAEPRTYDQRDKVSIVVPAYNAEETIEWVIESLTRQTWRNLEVIVVDDCSIDRTCDVVETLVREDQRIRLVRRPSNGGAYPARNAGAREATGDFIMIHDSDDWSHPQQVELQLEALYANPQCVGVKSHWVRTGENLEANGAWIPRGTLFDLNFSSLLIRRDTLDKIGLWDEVKISGDAEFYSRIRAIYGEDAVLKLPKRCLLSLSLTRTDSLTQSKQTHLRSLFYGLRWNYRDAYLSWHARLRIARDSLPFDATPGRRSFPVPLGNMTKRTHLPTYGLVVVSDFALAGAPLETALDYIVAARTAGSAVAVFHWRHYALEIRAPLQSKLYEICLRFGVDILSPGDLVDADTVLINCPSALEHQIEPRPTISAKQVIVVSDDQTSSIADFRTSTFDSAVARRNIENSFGTDSLWLSQSSVREWVMQQYDKCSVPLIVETV